MPTDFLKTEFGPSTFVWKYLHLQHLLLNFFFNRSPSFCCKAGQHRFALPSLFETASLSMPKESSALTYGRAHCRWWCQRQRSRCASRWRPGCRWGQWWCQMCHRLRPRLLPQLPHWTHKAQVNTSTMPLSMISRKTPDANLPLFPFLKANTNSWTSHWNQWLLFTAHPAGGGL